MSAYCQAWSAVALALGVAVTLCGIHLRAMQLLLPGTMIVGFGVGSGFSGAARSLLPLAEPDQRAGLLSAFYALSYLAFSLPTIAIGLVARRIGLVDASYLYGAVMIVLAVTSLTASLAPGWRGSVVRQGDGGGVGGLPRQAPPCPAELREP